MLVCWPVEVVGAVAGAGLGALGVSLEPGEKVTQVTAMAAAGADQAESENRKTAKSAP